MKNAVNGGFLAAIAENVYHLTELGRRAARHVIDAAYAVLATLHPLPAQDLERLADLLQKLVFSSLSAPEPPGKWGIVHSRRTDPGESASVVVRIDQYLSDLAAYRDDAHLAAWQTHIRSLELPGTGRGGRITRLIVAPPRRFARKLNLHLRAHPHLRAFDDLSHSW